MLKLALRGSVPAVSQRYRHLPGILEPEFPLPTLLVVSEPRESMSTLRSCPRTPCLGSVPGKGAGAKLCQAHPEETQFVLSAAELQQES